MKVVISHTKVKADHLAAINAAGARVLEALEREQPQGFRYTTCRLPDGVTYVILTEFGESVAQASIPGYAEFDEIVKTSIAEKPTVEKLTVSGSYRFF